MKVGDLITNINSESGEIGLFLGMRTFKRSSKYLKQFPDPDDYICAEVYWPERKKVGTIQTNLIEVINASR